jgi:hypothetical protein
MVYSLMLPPRQNKPKQSLFHTSRRKKKGDDYPMWVIYQSGIQSATPLVFLLD